MLGRPALGCCTLGRKSAFLAATSCWVEQRGGQAGLAPRGLRHSWAAPEKLLPVTGAPR